jgi:prepilin-type N-terminal cleavage/methylation domain-containing protein
LTGEPSGGFSLVEMLVVIAVVSVLAVGATLPLARSSATTGSESAALVETVRRVRDLSILSDATHAISIDGDGWRTERIIPGAGQRTVPGFAHELRSGLTALGRDAAETEAVRMVILPDGTSTPVRLQFHGNGGPVICDGTGGGDLTCRPG